MNTPVLGSASQFGSLIDQDDRRIGLFEEEDQKSKASESHDSGDVFAPAPSKVRSRDEATNERCKQRSREDRNTEDSNGNTSLSVVEHVGKYSSDDSKWTSAHETTEESANENCLQVLSNGHGDTEDRETERADKKR